MHEGKSKRHFCDNRDGKRYPYVQIGRQTWMAKNLEYVGDNGTMGRCARNEPGNCDVYGRLYTLDEMFCEGDCEQLQWGVADPNALTNNIACPIGWHLPSTVEMEELWTYSDPNFLPGSEASGTGNNVSATKLKAISWSGGTDEYGFAALPGGYCGSGCGNVATGTQQVGSTAFWWSHAHGYPVPLAKSWRMTTSAVVDDAFQSYSTSAFYTRCLKDVAPVIPTPEPAPQTTACEGNGAPNQKCHYGKWKNSFIDGRDQKEYATTTIGTQTWMAENLNFADENSVCYNGLDANCNIYGRLYNWNTTTGGTSSSANPSGVRGVCPLGWHVPSSSEWEQLITAIGSTNPTPPAITIVGAGAKLKAKSGWIENGSDEFDFTALPGSYGALNAGNIGNTINFAISRGGFWWGSQQQNANGARIHYIGPTIADAKRLDSDKFRYYSVRCVKD
jgi:uncharacterized protein (TIGR02145 family)